MGICLMNIFSLSSPHKIDPQTGEVFSQEDPTPFPKLKVYWLVIALFCIQCFGIGFVYFSLKNEIQVMYSQFDSLFQGVEESDLRVSEMGNKILEVLGDDEEFSNKNFWGDDLSAAHLQSIKYLGYYEHNRQRIAYTKSQLGDRFLTLNEKFNGQWRVKEITDLFLTLVGENDKTYTIHKVDF
jgi:hypothetical protein